MRINILAYMIAPGYYEFSGEVITAYRNGESVVYDLTDMPDGASMTHADPVDGAPAIIAATRTDGELYVTLAQPTIASQYPGYRADWRESGWMDAASYDQAVCHCIPTGMAGVEDYKIVRGTDVAGVEGWTVCKRSE